MQVSCLSAEALHSPSRAHIEREAARTIIRVAGLIIETASCTTLDLCLPLVFEQHAASLHHDMSRTAMQSPSKYACLPRLSSTVHWPVMASDLLVETRRPFASGNYSIQLVKGCTTWHASRLLCEAALGGFPPSTFIFTVMQMRSACCISARIQNAEPSDGLLHCGQ